MMSISTCHEMSIQVTREPSDLVTQLYVHVHVCEEIK